jgi:predicted enzyme related to lactoylglutathione lyase
MKNAITHFEIMVDDPERAVAFYTAVFGWEIKKWEMSDLGQDYWMVMAKPQGSKEDGINGGLLKRKGPAPEQGTSANAFVCTVVVEDYDATAAKIEQMGGVCQMPKFDLAGMAWQGYYKDTEGNIFGIHQMVKKG